MFCVVAVVGDVVGVVGDVGVLGVGMVVDVAVFVVRVGVVGFGSSVFCCSIHKPCLRPEKGHHRHAPFSWVRNFSLGAQAVTSTRPSLI